MHKHHNLLLLTLILTTMLSGCDYVISPITTTPAMMLGAYDKSKKRERWQEYAEKGDVYAQYELAESYKDGMLEGDINGQQAMHWYCQAARNGYAKAQVKLGQLYENVLTIDGLKVTKDNARAMMWYSMATRRINEEGRQRKKQLETVLTAQEKRDAKYLLRAPKHVPCGPEPLNWQNP